MMALQVLVLVRVRMRVRVWIDMRSMLIRRRCMGVVCIGIRMRWS